MYTAAGKNNENVKGHVIRWQQVLCKTKPLRMVEIVFTFLVIYEAWTDLDVQMIDLSIHDTVSSPAIA